MAHSGRERHRDREPGRRQLEEPEPPAVDRVYRMSGMERQEIADCLVSIDEARRALERQNSRENREIVRGLRAAADHIYDVINGLTDADPEDGIRGRS